MPVDSVGSGFHRRCYQSFTGLMKKYYLPKSVAADSISTACSSRSELDPQCTESSTSNLQSPCPSTSLLPDYNTIDVIISEVGLVSPVPLHNTENNLQVESKAAPSEIDLLTEIDAPNNSTCIFCDQKTKKHRSKRLPLISSNKKEFLSKQNQEDNNLTELINKVTTYPGYKVCYHKNCQLDFAYKTTSNKNTTKSSWHDLRDLHQIAFDEICDYINENVLKKGRCFFLTQLHRHYMEVLRENKKENSELVVGDFLAHNLELKLIKFFDRDIRFFYCAK